MSTGMLGAMLGMLVVLALGWIALLSVVRRRKALAERLEATVVSGGPLRRAQDRDIRLRAQRRRRFEGLAHVFNMPVDLPLAHVVAPPMVFVLGGLLGWGTFQLSGVIVPWAVALLVGVGAGYGAIRTIFGWETARYRSKLVSQLPDTIQLVVSATRAGLPVSESFRAIAREMLSPTREEFQRVEAAMALGETPDEALLALHLRTGVPEYAIFAVTIGVQARSGGRLAETIQNLADTIRERLTVVGRAKALASEAKASAVIMGSLPFIAALLMYFLRPDQIRLLLYDPRGQHMLAFGIITLGLGIFTMRQLIAGVGKE
jgi:tight adherence protein B